MSSTSMAQTSMNPVEPVSIIAINPFHSSRALGEKRSGGAARRTARASPPLVAQGAQRQGHPDCSTAPGDLARSTMIVNPLKNKC